MAKETKEAVNQDAAQQIAALKKRLDMLDERLDNIDSIVTAVAERVMKQPVSIQLMCTHCGHAVEIALVGKEKPTK